MFKIPTIDLLKVFVQVLLKESRDKWVQLQEKRRQVDSISFKDLTITKGTHFFFFLHIYSNIQHECYTTSIIRSNHV
jgi:hypothetical protein